jgi:hypothetical protein
LARRADGPHTAAAHDTINIPADIAAAALSAGTVLAIKTWRVRWESSLTPAEESIYEFMRVDRVAEVHGRGLTRIVKTEDRELAAGTHSFASGTMDITGPPDVKPLAAIQTPTYSFTIMGAERNATEACAEYMALLERMVSSLVSS